ncbi:hypothetical protein Cgig2_029101 [Carnegiea gigantea]|uniref:Uncharacterized protein n=1 Tax=Carnegiea gigantea TaxID=171969 RepID=A0A9Q1GPF0_9CARY|nr:hypothetical protein Cgig2_029101 [Carnegiea gigantea]
MADAITRQVYEQVKRAMGVAGSTKPVNEGEPSHWSEGMSSLRPMERSREVARSNRSDRLPIRRQGGVRHGTYWRIWVSDDCGLSNYLYSLCNTIQADCLARGAGTDLMLESIVNSMSRAGIPRPNGPMSPSTRTNTCSPLPQDEECPMEVMATIAGGYGEKITWSVWKA